MGLLRAIVKRRPSSLNRQAFWLYSFGFGSCFSLNRTLGHLEQLDHLLYRTCGFDSDVRTVAHIDPFKKEAQSEPAKSNPVQISATLNEHAATIGLGGYCWGLQSWHQI